MNALKKLSSGSSPPHILVTGGSRGIGLTVVKRLSAEGVNVFGTSSADGDLADPSTPQKIWAKALDALDGRIDALINNAAVLEVLSINESGKKWQESWDRTMRINLGASAELCRLAVLHFQQRETEGRIINVSSRAAHRGDEPDYWHYAASKAGLVNLIKTIARGYGRQSILAFAVCPGFTDTNMVSREFNEATSNDVIADIPLGKVAEPEEVAEVVAFLALRAPASMTGTVIDVNGASYVR
jgi:3-oxoacyl-[acyl-carrier protein] reductase